MIINCVVQVEAPDGTTHYFGDLLDNPTWVKFTKGDPNSHATRQHDQWYTWDRAWYFLCEHKPHWVKELPANACARAMAGYAACAEMCGVCEVAP